MNPVVRPGQLTLVIALTAQILDAMDVQPECRSRAFEQPPQLVGGHQDGSGAAEESDGNENASRLRVGFAAEWEAFGQALRRGDFDAWGSAGRPWAGNAS